MNSKRFFKLFCMIFLIVGVVLIVVGIVSQISTSKFLKTSIKADAKITNIITSRDIDGDLKSVRVNIMGKYTHLQVNIYGLILNQFAKERT